VRCAVPGGPGTAVKAEPAALWIIGYRQRPEAAARAKVTEAGLARLDELAEAGKVDEDTANLYRQLFEMRLDRVRGALGHASTDDVPDTSGLRQELVRAQRDKLAELWRCLCDRPVICFCAPRVAPRYPWLRYTPNATRLSSLWAMYTCSAHTHVEKYLETVYANPTM
jgi:hypothetical protein